MGVYLRMYKMEGNELILQRDCSNTIYYAMGYEYDYDGMTYTYNQTTLYSDISQEEGYDIYNFQKKNVDANLIMMYLKICQSLIWGKYGQDIWKIIIMQCYQMIIYI